ncbi:hypothetical protein SAMN05660657_03316 [Geodermatophilus amargosae]|uniref:Uncharacterized protein n=1 Tax=Geodermatophilus amargosae TaxID=1296565 RepID=A0A1I7B5V5_9ACTN|nr:hypothetical protein SAMN05660657_03316 [Geodermatophilus amargosae]
MASPVVQRPTVKTRPRPRPAVTYLSFDNSHQLRQSRLDRVRQMEEKQAKQSLRTYKQLVRALNTALAQTKTTKKSSKVNSKRTPKGQVSKSS